VCSARSGQRPPGAPRRVGSQLCGAFEEGRRGCRTSARLGAVSRTLEFDCDVLIGQGGGLGLVPRVAIRIAVNVGGFCQSAVNRSALF
jgi:hypothetical protein